MSDKKEKLLTIGEISKMTNIPIRTFHFYDEIGLFKPVHIDEKTKYRYYSESQIHHLDLIKSLKYIGTSLENIKYAQSLTPEQLVQFLAEQQAVVEERLRKMQEVQETLLKTKNMLEEQINIPVFEEVYEMDAIAQRIVAIKTSEANVLYIPEKYFSALSETVERGGTVMNSRYGGIIPLKDYGNVKDMYYDYIFTPLLTERYLEKLNRDVEIFNIPAGRYACIAFEYSEQMYLKNYEKLLRCIRQQINTEATTVYEVFMPTNYSPSKKSTFIVELKIQIH